MDIANIIKESRINLNLTQRSFAEVLCVSESTVQKWEVGRNCPTIDMLSEVLALAGKKLSVVEDIAVTGADDPCEDILYKKATENEYVENDDMEKYKGSRCYSPYAAIVYVGAWALMFNYSVMQVVDEFGRTAQNEVNVAGSALEVQVQAYAEEILENSFFLGLSGPIAIDPESYSPTFAYLVLRGAAALQGVSLEVYVDLLLMQLKMLHDMYGDKMLDELFAPTLEYLYGLCL